MNRQAGLLRTLDPSRSFVVIACAGSGKTWLLISRIIRAMLAGARPEEILAITFTRKATKEIAERIRARLKEFDEAGDAELARMLAEIGADTSPRILRRARALRRKFLLSNKRMPIRTFHSWFQHLLRGAPWLPDASRSDDVAENADTLLAESWRSFLATCAPDGPAGKGLLELVRLTDYSFDTVREMLGQAIARAEFRQRLEGAKNRPGAIEAECRNLQRLLNVADNPDPIARLQSSRTFWLSLDAVRAAAADAKSGAQGAKKLCAEELAPSRRHQGREFWGALKGILLTRAGTVRKDVFKATRVLEHVRDHLETVRREFEGALAAECAIAAVDFNRNALPAVAGWLSRYGETKEQRGEIDYADIEIRACELLCGSGPGGTETNAQAIQYKMGQAYRHILVDEFQDTNNLQWTALRAWLEGVRGSGDEPKVFIVGDPKQSVYRFRGGNPDLLGVAGEYLGEHYRAETVPHNETRRCAPKLLDVVNRVFGPHMEGFEEHRAHPGNARFPGRVEVLSPSPPTAREPPAEARLRNPLTTPYPEKSGADTSMAEAAQIAAKMREVKEKWLVTRSNGAQERCGWGDFMVLFSQRTRSDDLERALRAADIPCISGLSSGLGSLECADMMALMGFAVNPHADWALLQVLRSPLFDVAAEDLAALARDHGDRTSMWDRFPGAARLSPRMRRAREMLARWREEYLAVPLPVHDFLSRVYAQGEVFARYEMAVPKTLRHRVRANLLRILHLTLSLDKGRQPQLPRYLRELRRLRAAEAKWNLDAPLSDEVALLTIHSAKGLERPFVFLFDAARRRFGKSQRGGKLHWRMPPDVDAQRAFVALVRPCDGHLPLFRDADAAEREAEERERTNRLYIALTRARQAVFVSGMPADSDGKKTWWDQIGEAVGDLAGAGARAYGDSLEGEALSAPAKRDPLAAQARVPRREQEEEAAASGGGHASDMQSRQQERGEMLHALLALRISGGTTREVAKRAVPAGAQEFEELWSVSSRMLRAPAVRRLLGSRRTVRRACEVEVAGPDGKPRRMDCIVERGGELWILDFKSGKIKPHLKKYRQQMEDYRECLRLAAPGKPVRCALVSEEGEVIRL